MVAEPLILRIQDRDRMEIGLREARGKERLSSSPDIFEGGNIWQTTEPESHLENWIEEMALEGVHVFME